MAVRPFFGAAVLTLLCGLAWYTAKPRDATLRAGLAARAESSCVDATAGPVLDGYDVVAYFSLAAGASAVLGDASLYAHYGNYTFHFSSEENRALFLAAPYEYVPQFGGFCAWGISEESWWTKATLGPDADPNVWEVVDGKLYLFMFDKPKEKFMGELTDDDLDASADTTAYIAAGEERWSGWWEERHVFNTGCFWWDSSSDTGVSKTLGGPATLGGEYRGPK